MTLSYAHPGIFNRNFYVLNVYVLAWADIYIKYIGYYYLPTILISIIPYYNTPCHSRGQYVNIYHYFEN